MAAALFSRLSAAENPPPWGLWTVFVSIIVAYVMILMGTFLGTYFIGATALALLVGWIIACLLIIGFVMLSRRDRASLRLEDQGRTLIFAALTGLGVAILLDVIGLRVTGEFLLVPELFGLTQETPTPAMWIAAFWLMVVVQPVAEELVFRGIAFPALRRAFGPWLGLIVCALAYALFHQLAYSAPATPLWYGLTLPLLAGLFITAVRMYTGSTRAAIAAHMAFGLFAVLKALTFAS
jgi:membrane protease YdiL (CAAX protease family)